MLKIFVLLLVTFFCINSCSESVLKPINNSVEINTKVELNGKWKETHLDVKVFFEEELHKIVLSNGCQIVTANYAKYDQAVSFSNIIATEKTCDIQGMQLETILSETIMIKNKAHKQIVFLNKDFEELLILNKN